MRPRRISSAVKSVMQRYAYACGLFLLLVSHVNASVADEPKRFTIFMIGDSTMANKPVIPENQERGWGNCCRFTFKAM